MKFKLLLSCSLILVLASSCAVVRTNMPNNHFSIADSYYYLPETVLDVELKLHLFKVDSGEWQLRNQEITIIPQIKASNDLFMLKHMKNGLFDDKLVLKSNEQGLLESVSLDVTDKSGEIITDIAKTVISAFGGGTPVSSAALASTADTITIQIQRQYRLAEFNSKEKKISIVETIPFEFKDTIYSWNSEMSLQLDDYKFSTVNLELHERINGVLTRPMKTAKILIVTDPESLLAVSREVYINVVDESKLILVPISRTAFVQKKQTLTFSNGILISNDLDVPSCVKSAFNIPLEIAKAIIALPAELVQLKFNFSGNKDQLDQLDQNLKRLQEQQNEILKKIEEKGKR